MSQQTTRRQQLVQAMIFLALLISCQRLGCGGDEPSSLSGRIVFFGYGPADEDPPVSRIASMRPDGTDIRVELTLDLRLVGGGRVGPDGRTFAFNGLDEAPVDGHIRSASLWIRERDHPPRKLRRDGWVCDWHPTGESLLVYRSERDDDYENLIVDVHTGESRKLDLPDGSVAQAWMPDGKTLIVIAMNSDRRFEDPERGSYPQRRLYLWDTQTKQQTLFTDAEHDCIWPAVSPDGSRIVHYLRRHAERPLEFLAAADPTGENERELASVDDVTDDTIVRPTGFPHWSPDGSEIAWMRTVQDRESRETDWEILFISSDGSSWHTMPLDKQFRWGYFDWVE
jgi:hypothetical protein